MGRFKLKIFLSILLIQILTFGSIQCEQSFLTPKSIEKLSSITFINHKDNKSYNFNSLVKQYNNKIILYVSDGKQKIPAGILEYKLKSSYLYIEYIKTHIDFRKQGISKLLLNQFLNKHDDIKKIEAYLDETNLEVFIEHYNSNAMAAAVHTPLVKSLAKLGFTLKKAHIESILDGKIVNVSRNELKDEEADYLPFLIFRK